MSCVINEFLKKKQSLSSMILGSRSAEDDRTVTNNSSCGTEDTLFGSENSYYSHLGTASQDSEIKNQNHD